MASFDKCPVCGGGIKNKKVEKIVRVGDLFEIVKIQAEVCLRCGEWLYAPPVELTVPKRGASFPADLKRVRDEVKRKFSTPEVFFDLKVLAVEGETLIAKWYFAPAEVPDLDVMIFYEESQKAHRVALIESNQGKT